MRPTELFKKWINEEKKLSKAAIPTAVCLCTNGIDGFPNARTVSFKEIIKNAFVITGPLNSRKGIELENNNKVALTFWWTETERQVRVQGTASKLPDELADKYFSSRDINSQAVSSVCTQGKEIINKFKLEEKIEEKVSKGAEILRPTEWGGFSIKPIRIEFMEFKKTRFHDRKLYEIVNDRWNIKQIQP